MFPLVTMREKNHLRITCTCGLFSHYGELFTEWVCASAVKVDSLVRVWALRHQHEVVFMMMVIKFGANSNRLLPAQLCEYAEIFLCQSVLWLQRDVLLQGGETSVFCIQHLVPTCFFATSHYWLSRQFWMNLSPVKSFSSFLYYCIKYWGKLNRSLMVFCKIWDIAELVDQCGFCVCPLIWPAQVFYLLHPHSSRLSHWIRHYQIQRLQKQLSISCSEIKLMTLKTSRASPLVHHHGEKSKGSLTSNPSRPGSASPPVTLELSSSSSPTYSYILIRYPLSQQV